MANLFSRVGLKNGDRAGEVLVQSQPSGEVLHLRRGVAMPPAPLDGKPLPLDSTVERRQYFADWLTARDNPYFARALVNRVWRNFLGRGLVEAEDDLRQTNPPTNPELLDALARDFAEHSYDVKHLIRTIMRSAAYQRSSQPLPGNARDDRFYSRYLIRRLPAEVILDAYAHVTGVPTPFNQIKSGASDSTSPYAGYPLGTRALQLPDSKVASQFLDAFGRPDRAQACSCDRQQDSSVRQALHVNNGQTLNDKIRAKNCRIETWLNEKISDEDAVRRLFALALCREPSPAEMQKFKGFLTEAVAQGSRREGAGGPVLGGADLERVFVQSLTLFLSLQRGQVVKPQFLLLAAFFLVGWHVQAEAADPPRYSQDIKPLMTRYCVQCHNSTRARR